MIEGNPPAPVLAFTHQWCFDRLQPWRYPEEGLDTAQYRQPNPVTDWMAEKPIILGETARYVSFDAIKQGNDAVDGDPYFEDIECFWNTHTCNAEWYADYLDKAKSRHIESLVFWSGDGGPYASHLVRGTPLFGERDNYIGGWQRPFALHSGGDAIRAYAP